MREINGINLGKVAWAYYIYPHFAQFDHPYEEFRKKINNQLNIENKNHRIALLKWLNRWGCRQFSARYYELASNEILK